MSAIRRVPIAVFAYTFSFLPEDARYAQVCTAFRDATRESMQQIDRQLKASSHGDLRTRYLAIIANNPDAKPYILLRKLHEEQRQEIKPQPNMTPSSFGLQRFEEAEKVITQELNQATRSLWATFRQQVNNIPDLESAQKRLAWLDDPTHASACERVQSLALWHAPLRLLPYVAKFKNLRILHINITSRGPVTLPEELAALKNLRILAVKGHFAAYPTLITQLPNLLNTSISTEGIDHLPEEAWTHAYTGFIFTAWIYPSFAITALVAPIRIRGAVSWEFGNPIFTSNFKSYPFGLWFQRTFLILGNSPYSLLTSAPAGAGALSLLFSYQGISAVWRGLKQLFHERRFPHLEEWGVGLFYFSVAILLFSVGVAASLVGLVLNLPIIFYNLFMMKIVFPLVMLVRDALKYDRMVQSEG